MIKINNLQKFFNNECILDGINLYIKKDEFVVLLGASGSGKSTLLKILSGYESFEYGDVSVFFDFLARLLLASFFLLVCTDKFGQSLILSTTCFYFSVTDNLILQGF
ncbi:MAG: ATP-binding cassette domain-containing protein [Enterococcus casseliflavus]|nr:ATP-binding cassette domain-containing protein [Enterococcus casseliflavus]